MCDTKIYLRDFDLITKFNLTDLNNAIENEAQRAWAISKTLESKTKKSDFRLGKTLYQISNLIKKIK